MEARISVRRENAGSAVMAGSRRAIWPFRSWIRTAICRRSSGGRVACAGALACEIAGEVAAGDVRVPEIIERLRPRFLQRQRFPGAPPVRR